MIKETHRAPTQPSSQTFPFTWSFEMICLYYEALPIAKGYLTVSQFSLFDKTRPDGEGKSLLPPPRLRSKISI